MSFGGEGGNQQRAMSEINVTPLVDVMLVLLVVFMVTTPLIVPATIRNVDMNLPHTNAEPVEQSKLTTIITIHADKRILLNRGEGDSPLLDTCPEYPACLQGFEEKLKLNPTLEDFRQGERIYLMADRTLPYGYVIDVMARFKNAGITQLGMVTNPPEELMPKGPTP